MKNYTLFLLIITSLLFKNLYATEYINMGEKHIINVGYAEEDIDIVSAQYVNDKIESLSLLPIVKKSSFKKILPKRSTSTTSYIYFNHKTNISTYSLIDKFKVCSGNTNSGGTSYIPTYEEYLYTIAGKKTNIESIIPYMPKYPWKKNKDENTATTGPIYSSNISPSFVNNFVIMTATLYSNMSVPILSEYEDVVEVENGSGHYFYRAASNHMKDINDKGFLGIAHGFFPAYGWLSDDENPTASYLITTHNFITYSNSDNKPWKNFNGIWIKGVPENDAEFQQGLSSSPIKIPVYCVNRDINYN